MRTLDQLMREWACRRMFLCEAGIMIGRELDHARLTGVTHLTLRDDYAVDFLSVSIDGEPMFEPAEALELLDRIIKNQTQEER